MRSSRDSLLAAAAVCAAVAVAVPPAAARVPAGGGAPVPAVMPGGPPAAAAAAPTRVPVPLPLASRCERLAGGHRYRCLAGPITVPPGQRVEFVTGVAAPSEAGFVVSARADLLDAAGERVPHAAVHLHHAVWLNPTRDDLTCAAYDGVLPDHERFFASGSERTPVNLPDGYGYHWTNTVPQPHTGSAPYWELVAMLDGADGHTGVFITLDLGFVPQGEAADMVAVRPVWFDVRNCSSHPTYDVEQGSGNGRWHEEHWRYRMPVGGRFVFLGGHLHDGGLALRLRNDTTGREVFTSLPVYGHGHHGASLTGMTTFSSRAGIGIRPGDVLRLTAVYDSTRTHHDVMGIMVGALAPAAGNTAARATAPRGGGEGGRVGEVVAGTDAQGVGAVRGTVGPGVGGAVGAAAR